MSHETVRAALGRYLERELDAAERIEVERHLASCAGCSAEAEELRATVDLLRSLPDPPHPAHLADAVMQRLAASGTRQSGGFAALLGRWLSGPAPLPLAALGCGLLVLALVRASGPAPDPALPQLERTLGVPVLAARNPGAVERPLAVPSAPPGLPSGAVARRAAPTPVVFTADGAARGRVRPTLVSESLHQVAGPVVQGASLRRRESRWEAALPPLRELALLCLGLEGASGDVPSPAQLACRPWLSGMLTLAQFDGRSFMVRLGHLPATEREAWIEELVHFAAGAGTAANVAAGLRAVGDPSSLSLARRFEGAWAGRAARE